MSNEGKSVSAAEIDRSSKSGAKIDNSIVDLMSFTAENGLKSCVPLCFMLEKRRYSYMYVNFIRIIAMDNGVLHCFT